MQFNEQLIELKSLSNHFIFFNMNLKIILKIPINYFSAGDIFSLRINTGVRHNEQDTFDNFF